MSNALLLVGAGALLLVGAGALLVVGAVGLLIRYVNRSVSRRLPDSIRTRHHPRGVPLPVRRTSSASGTSAYDRSTDRRRRDEDTAHTGLFAASSWSHGSQADHSPSHHSSGGYHTGGGIGGGGYDSGSSSSDSCSSSSDSGGCGGGGD